jgi:hypothetical protein
MKNERTVSNKEIRKAEQENKTQDLGSKYNTK